MPPERVETDLYLGFRWKSATPLAGLAFESWRDSIRQLAEAGALFVARGYYFADEAEDEALARELAAQRIGQSLEYLQLPSRSVAREVLPQQVMADVRSIVFEAFQLEAIDSNDLVVQRGDTMEVCFPLKDTLRLAAFSKNRLEQWAQQTPPDSRIQVVGIADATGIAEAADIAYERAEIVKNILIKVGKAPGQISLSAGQRSQSNPLRNRCVIIYIEDEMR